MFCGCSILIDPICSPQVGVVLFGLRFVVTGKLRRFTLAEDLGVVHSEILIYYQWNRLEALFQIYARWNPWNNVGK